MAENYSLFDEQDDAAERDLFENVKPYSGKIDVVRMDFQEAQTVSWESLFVLCDKDYSKRMEGEHKGLCNGPG